MRALSFYNFLIPACSVRCWDGTTKKFRPLRPRASKPTARNLVVATPTRRGGAALARKPELLQSDDEWENF
jgi:hypothetical protein